MTDSVRNIITVIATLIAGLLFGIGMIDMPPPGDAISSYGQLLTNLAIEQQQTLNTVSGVLFDLRSLDTLGEALIIFTASAGLNVILQLQINEVHLDDFQWVRPNRSLIPLSEAIQTMCLSVVSVVTIYGIYLIIRGHLSVGGGFHGGVVVITAMIFIYLAGHYPTQKQIAHEELLETSEAIGIGGYATVGLAALGMTGILLANILPLGETGDILSSGIIPLLSVLVGLEAIAAMGLIVINMQEQLFEREERR